VEIETLSAFLTFPAVGFLVAATLIIPGFREARRAGFDGVVDRSGNRIGPYGALAFWLFLPALPLVVIVPQIVGYEGVDSRWNSFVNVLALASGIAGFGGAAGSGLVLQRWSPELHRGRAVFFPAMLGATLAILPCLVGLLGGSWFKFGTDSLHGPPTSDSSLAVSFTAAYVTWAFGLISIVSGYFVSRAQGEGRSIQISMAWRAAPWLLLCLFPLYLQLSILSFAR